MVYYNFQYHSFVIMVVNMARLFLLAYWHKCWVTNSLQQLWPCPLHASHMLYSFAMSFITFIYIHVFFAGSSGLHRGTVHWRRKWCRRSGQLWKTGGHVAGNRISAVKVYFTVPLYKILKTIYTTITSVVENWFSLREGPDFTLDIKWPPSQNCAVCKEM